MGEEHRCMRDGEFQTLKTNQKHLFERIKKVEEKADILYDLASSVKELGNEIKHMRDDTQEIKDELRAVNTDIMTFKTAGSKKWDNFIWWALIFIAGVIANSFVNQILGG